LGRAGADRQEAPRLTAIHAEPMNIVIAAIGRARGVLEHDLYESYLKRLPWRVTLKEIEIKKDLATDVRRLREAEALLAAVPDGAHIIALDERGKTEDSVAFARRWRDDGVRGIAFMIGGADGLDDKIRKRADFVLSFGAMTWPHMLVRTMLAEQLYRAHTILTGHPYHRG
jgi:23S rRNA (pseudouridine1915-N3)-methyltransferase